MTQPLTQSAASAFRACRKKAELRYERGLAPIEDADALRFGKVVHDGLAVHFNGGNSLAWIDRATGIQDVDQAVARALLQGYLNRWTEPLESVAVELAWEHAIRNPDTGANSRTWHAAGKWDGVVRRADGRLWLIEHKTTSRIDAAYLERLWLDFQIAYYCQAIVDIYGEAPAGVIYDIIAKPPKGQMARDPGETDAEWQARLAEAKAPGRCKRRMGESHDDYRARLQAWADEPSHYHREEILLTQDDLDQVLAETWDLGQTWLEARRTGRWYRNTDQCYGKYGQPCDYLRVCRSRENPVVIETSFQRVDANRELTEAAPAF